MLVICGCSRCRCAFCTPLPEPKTRLRSLANDDFDTTKDAGLGSETTGNAINDVSPPTFKRFNPAIGFTTNPTPDLTFYGTYNEGVRAPTPVDCFSAQAATAP
jgi:outer membrane receptor protein involved in Fe transport